VCNHLTGGTAGLGFNCGEPSAEKPFPDGWCDDCELIREAHDGWNEESERLVEILLLCSECYGRARIRNTRTTVTMDDLATLRWKCGSCEEWHTGPCLDFSYDAPYYWTREHAAPNNGQQPLTSSTEEGTGTFLDEAFCAIDDADFFVYGIIELPIIGSAETFRWGVWGSLSRESFETLRRTVEDPECVDLPPMFSWLSTQIEGYPNTLSLKMYARVQEPGGLPNFELEETDHPLAQEHHRGIAAERIKEIMTSRFTL
jgi:hypothetical protein